jgi:hypothetical protein
MKINITESQLKGYFDEVMTEINNGIINESLTQADKNDIKSIVKKEIKDFLENNRSIEFENKVSDIIRKKLKTDKENEKFLVDLTKNVLIQLYKNLWTRRNMWSSDLKNSPN